MSDLNNSEHLSKNSDNISNDENRSTTNFQYKISITDAVPPLLDYLRVSKLKEMEAKRWEKHLFVLVFWVLSFKQNLKILLTELEIRSSKIEKLTCASIRPTPWSTTASSSSVIFNSKLITILVKIYKCKFALNWTLSFRSQPASLSLS